MAVFRDEAGQQWRIRPPGPSASNRQTLDYFILFVMPGQRQWDPGRRENVQEPGSELPISAHFAYIDLYNLEFGVGLDVEPWPPAQSGGS